MSLAAVAPPCPRQTRVLQCSSSSLEWIRRPPAQRWKPNPRVGRTGWIPGRRLRSTSTAVFGRFIAGRRTRAYPFTGINTRNSARCSRTRASSTPGSAREARIRTSEQQTDQTASAPRSFLTVALTLAAAVVVIGVISYLVASRFHSDRGQGKTPVAGLELISTFAGSHRWPSLSPDGRMVAFVSDAAGTPQVWVKNLGGWGSDPDHVWGSPGVAASLVGARRPHHLFGARRRHLVRGAARG